MKRIHIFILIFTILLSLSGCNAANHQNEDQNAKADVFIEKTENVDAPEDPTPESPEIPKIPIRFEEQELTQISILDYDSAEHEPFPVTLSALTSRLGENGSIVAGHAIGTRESQSSAVTTLTTFAVEKVYWGKEVSSIITVEEPYALRYDEENTPYILTRGYEHYRLENDQPVLLFLRPSAVTENAYVIFYVPFPLPADHQSYTDEYLTEFLDYFRGDRSAYHYPERITKEVEIAGQLLTAEYGGTYWSEQDISDQELLQQLGDQLIVRLAADLKIKLWPYEHRQYGANDLPTTQISYFRTLSYPPDPVLGYIFQ